MDIICILVAFVITKAIAIYYQDVSLDRNGVSGSHKIWPLRNEPLQCTALQTHAVGTQLGIKKICKWVIFAHIFYNVIKQSHGDGPNSMVNNSSNLTIVNMCKKHLNWSDPLQ